MELLCHSVAVNTTHGLPNTELNRLISGSQAFMSIKLKETTGLQLMFLDLKLNEKVMVLQLYLKTLFNVCSYRVVNS